MRISELSEATGVRVATIKYYLREGLLHEGELLSKTRASYDETHVGRLRLIRALLEAGGLPVNGARAVLQQLDEPPESLHELVGSAAMRLPPVVAGDGAEPARALTLLQELGWNAVVGVAGECVAEECAAGECEAGCVPDVAGLDRALRALEDAGLGLSGADLVAYGRAMEDVARREIAGTPPGDPSEAVRYVVLGTVLVEPVLLSLRRLAHVEESARLLGGRPGPPGAAATK